MHINYNVIVNIGPIIMAFETGAVTVFEEV